MIFHFGIILRQTEGEIYQILNTQEYGRDTVLHTSQAFGIITQYWTT